jgi:hypothetical protein
MPRDLFNSDLIRITDGGKIVILMQQPRSTLQKNIFLVSGTHFYQRMSKPKGLVRPEGLGKFEKKLIPFIGSRIRVFPACSVLPRTPEVRFMICKLCPLSSSKLQRFETLALA